jgi:hypothetical protein
MICYSNANALTFVGDEAYSEICGLLGNYTASCGNYLPTFLSFLFLSFFSFPFFPFLPFLLGILTREDGTDTLPRNVGK